MRTLTPLLERLITPASVLPENSPDRYRAQLTLTISLLLEVLYFIPELVLLLLSPRTPDTTHEILMIAAGAGVLALGYLFARTKHYRVGAWLTLLGWTFDVLLDTALGESVARSEIGVWLLFGLVMAFLLLDLHAYGAFVVIQILAVRAILAWKDAAVVHFDPFLHLSGVALLGIGVWLRERDQRQRQIAQEALQEQKDYLQRVIDGVQSPFYVIDVQNYRIQLANRAARFLGLHEQTTTCYALTHGRTEPCSGDEHPCPLQHVQQTREPYTTEHIHIRPDGSTYYAEVRGYPLFDNEGNVVQMVEYSVDITERKQAEAQIHKLQRAIEHAASGVLITDADGVIEYVNQAFVHMTGYRREEAIGQTPKLLKSGQHPREFYAGLWQTIQDGRVWQGEMLNRRKDGSLYWEFQTIAPVSLGGRITHYVAVKQDITRQKELEQELIAAKEAAEQANAFKSRLLANVSHDMRTPLGGIIGYAEMLLDDVYGALNTEQKALLQDIVDNANRLASFISGMLTRAELESGKIRLKPRPFPPQDLLKSLTAHEDLARQKGLTFSTEVDPALPAKLYGDPYWLNQILINLVDNAIKYTSEGAVQVRLKRVDTRRWAIEVQDTGIGIPEELHSQIFNAFEQVEDTPGKRIQGVGLGLSIVKELAHRLGGEIHLQSAPGAGSTFTVIFPIQEAEHEA